MCDLNKTVDALSSPNLIYYTPEDDNLFLIPTAEWSFIKQDVLCTLVGNQCGLIYKTHFTTSILVFVLGVERTMKRNGFVLNEMPIYTIVFL